MISRLIGDYNSSNPTVRKGKLYYGWIVLLACFVIGVIGPGIQVSFGVFFKSLEADFGLTRASTSGIFSVHLLLALVFSIVGGWALDRYGPRTVVTLMGIFTGLSMLLASRASALWHLYSSYSLLLAMGMGAIFPVLMSTVSRWFIKRRGLAIGIVASGMYVGMIVMAPLSAYLISGYGWRKSYFVLSLIGLSVIIPFALLLRRAPSEVSVLADSEKPKAINPNSAEKRAYNEPGGFSLSQAVKTRSFRILFFTWFLIGGLFYTVTTHIVPHAIDLGITPATAALILSLFGGASIAGSVVIGMVSDNMGRRKSIIGCSLLMTVAMLWLVWASNLWMLCLFAAVFGFSFAGVLPALTALGGDTFGLRHLGKIMGVLEAGFMLGGAFGPAFAGYIFDVRGSYVFAFLVGVLAALAAAVIIFLFRATKQ